MIIIIIIIIKKRCESSSDTLIKIILATFWFFFSMWSLKNNEKINQRIGGQVQLSTMNTDRTRDYIIILLKLIISSKTNDAVISTGK